MNKGRRMKRKENPTPMRDGWYTRNDDAGHVERVVQPMDDEHGVPKFDGARGRSASSIIFHATER